jgi:hypothetical protein
MRVQSDCRRPLVLAFMKTVDEHDQVVVTSIVFYKYMFCNFSRVVAGR